MSNRRDKLGLEDPTAAYCKVMAKTLSKIVKTRIAVILIVTAFFVWNVYQDISIKQLGERLADYVIRTEKQDGILDFTCWCSNQIYCQDGEGIFMYRCAGCDTLYTNTECQTVNEFYELVGQRVFIGNRADARRDKVAGR